MRRSLFCCGLALACLLAPTAGVRATGETVAAGPAAAQASPPPARPSPAPPPPSPPLAPGTAVGNPPVRFPDLAGLEPAVAEQIAGGQRRLAALAAVGSNAAPDRHALAEAFGELGQLFHAYSLREPAEACYANARRLAPQDFRWPHLLGILLQDAGRLDEALAAFDAALAREPRDTAALLYQAEVFRLQGATEAAEATARRVLAADPGSAAAKALLGQCALDGGDAATAVPLLEEALAAVPAAGRLHYLLATAYRGTGDEARAKEHLGKAGPVGVRPDDPLLAGLDLLRSGERLQLARGKTAFQAGRYEEAAEHFRRALAARPESAEARINLAAVLAQQGDRAGAAAALREALAREPDNATAHFNLGVLLAGQGPSEEARAQLAAAAAGMPGDAEAARTLARMLRDLGRLDEALAEYGRAVALDPADEAARLGEAETLVRLERWSEARAHLEDSLVQLPGSGLLAHGLARLLAACPDLAVRDGKRALQLAFAVWQAQPSAAHAETVALANAELGDCAEAARWQQITLDAAGEEKAPAARVEELKTALAKYGRGYPCR